MMIKKVEKYVVTTVLQSIFVILASLCALQIFILFVNQMGELGRGQYTFGIVVQYVLMRLPYELTMCFPVICLLGCLVGLSILANHSELIILRANGLSIFNLLGMVARVGIGLIIVTMLLTECFVPQLMFKANNLKLEALNNGHLYRQAHSIWFRHHEHFWYIGAIGSSQDLQNITMFQKDKIGVLKSVEYFKDLHWHNDQWYSDASEKTFFSDEKVEHLSITEPQRIDLPLTPTFFKHVEQNPDEMSLIHLWQRIHQLNKQQNIAKDELIFWQRLFQPANTLLMMLLAIPCIFGPLRSSTMGAKLVAGIALGFGFYILNQMFGFVSQVYQIPPIMGATIPMLIFGSLGVVLMSRTR